MLQFENLSIRGFGSIGEFDINLNQKGITIIKGANGTGKTTWLSALVWCLYGKNLKGVSEVTTWSRYRNSSYQGTLVTVHWKKGGIIYKLTRCQNYQGQVDGAKGANRILFYKDALPIDDKRKADIQNSINQSLGLSYDLFMSSMMFGQGMKRLIQESNSDQKAIFEEIFSLAYITSAQKIAKEAYQEVYSRYLECENVYNKIYNSLEVTKNNHEKSLEILKEFRENQDAKLKKITKALDLATTELEEIRAKEPPKRDYEKRLKALKEESKQINASIFKIKDQLDNLSFYDLMESMIIDLENKKYGKVLKGLKDIQAKYSQLENHEEQLKSIRETLHSLEKSQLHYKSWLERVESKEENIKWHKRQFRGLQKENPPTINKSLEHDISKLTKQLQEKDIELNEIRKKANLLKWAYTDPLGPNGLKAYIFDTSVDELNEILRGYSETLGIQVKFVIDTTSTRKEFETIITMDGNIILFEELSGGQKQLVHLAMALAMNQLVNDRHQVNIAFMDEVFESLSFDNIEIVVNLLRKIYRDKNLFLITHYDSLPLGNARTIEVSINKGLSQYKI